LLTFAVDDLALAAANTHDLARGVVRPLTPAEIPDTNVTLAVVRGVGGADSQARTLLLKLYVCAVGIRVTLFSLCSI
jgi:hypothetical protein